MMPLGPEEVATKYGNNNGNCGPLKLSTQPGKGSLQAAETMLGRMTATGSSPPSPPSRLSASAWRGVQGSDYQLTLVKV
jgi:hypothetical protein